MNNKIIISDLHLKLNTKEFADKLKDQIISYMKKGEMTQENTDLLILGDTYNDKAIIRSEVQSFFLKWLESISHHFKNIICVIGNHDLENNNSDQSGLEILSSIVENFICVTNFYKINESLFVGYQNSLEKFQSCLKIIDASTKYLFCHQGFNGFNLNGSNTVCNDGFNSDVIPSNVQVFSGHFHSPQCKNNLMYIGSAWSQDHSESNQKKRFIVIDSDYKISSVEIQDIRKHVDVVTDVKKNDDILKVSIDAQFEKLNNRDIIRWKVIGDKINVDEIIKYIVNKNIKYNFLLSLRANYTYNKKSFVIKDDMSPVDMFNKYIDFNAERFNDVNIVELKNKGLEYLS